MGRAPSTLLPPLSLSLLVGIAEPLPVAETFTFDADDGKQLMRHASLDTTVTVVDGFNFFRDYTNGETLADRHMDAYKGDDRAVVDLLVDQIEFADGSFRVAACPACSHLCCGGGRWPNTLPPRATTCALSSRVPHPCFFSQIRRLALGACAVIILNKIDMLTDEQRGFMLALLRRLNPDAKILESVHSRVPVGAGVLPPPPLPPSTCRGSVYLVCLSRSCSYVLGDLRAGS